MKKSTFAVGVVMTVVGIWGIFNPLAYINGLGRVIEPILMGGTMDGVDGFVGLFLVLLIMVLHLGLIISFWTKVVKRIKEVM